MELLNRTFTSQSVAMATGFEPKAIQNWASRNLLIGHRDGTGKGHHIRFSWFNLMEVAIAGALMNVGVSSIQDAFAAAQNFAHNGESPATFMGDEVSGPMRSPCLPWHHGCGQTFLLIWNGGNKVKLTDHEGTVRLSSITPAGIDFDGIIALNVSNIFARVCNRMALDYREVLDEAYPDDAKG